MSFRAIISGMTLLASCLMPAVAQQSEAEHQLMLKLMQETKLDAVMDADVSSFEADKDPSTLQIVFVQDPKFTQSKISDDGEVIFVSDATPDDQQQALIKKAFEIRARLRMPKS